VVYLTIKVIFSLAGQNRHVPRDTTTNLIRSIRWLNNVPLYIRGWDWIHFHGNWLFSGPCGACYQTNFCHVQYKTYSWVGFSVHTKNLDTTLTTELPCCPRASVCDNQSVFLTWWKPSNTFSQPTEVVLASGLEPPPNLYYELCVKKNVLFLVSRAS
jgi:hypothetical protein